MNKFYLPLVLFASLLILPSFHADAKTRYSSSHHSSVSHGHSYHSSRPATRSYHTKAVSGVKRDHNGKIARSFPAKHKFIAKHPCPSTGKTLGACQGYVIDHIKPLKRGGSDTPDNMQWQTKDAAKAKDKWE